MLNKSKIVALAEYLQKTAKEKGEEMYLRFPLDEEYYNERHSD